MTRIEWLDQASRSLWPAGMLRNCGRRVVGTWPPGMDEDVLPYGSEFAVLYGFIGCGGHSVDWDRVPVVFPIGMEY